MFGNW